jgi:hypothetical protein
LAQEQGSATREVPQKTVAEWEKKLVDKVSIKSVAAVQYIE